MSVTRQLEQIRACNQDLKKQYTLAILRAKEVAHELAIRDKKFMSEYRLATTGRSITNYEATFFTTIIDQIDLTKDKLAVLIEQARLIHEQRKNCVRKVKRLKVAVKNQSKMEVRKSAAGNLQTASNRYKLYFYSEEKGVVSLGLAAAPSSYIKINKQR